MNWKRCLIFVLLAGLTTHLTFSSAIAEDFTFLGRPGNIFGYITQEGSYGLIGGFDTQHGLNAALMNVFVEGDYQPTDTVKFYGSGMLTVDWIYQLLHNNSQWDKKEFDQSKSLLNIDDQYWQLLKEVHLTWTPNPYFMFRVGKQIVSWGELLGGPIVNQINPTDGRRGFTSVELETSYIPIWLVRAEYYSTVKPSWLTDLAFQFIWNPKK